MKVKLRRRCPQCGAKMKVVSHEELQRYQLACTGCPLDYGRYWFCSEQEVIEAWETAPKRKVTKGRTKARSVVKIDRNGNVLERYSSLSEAAKKNPMSKTSIENRAKRRVRDEFSICDFTFRLEDDAKV